MKEHYVTYKQAVKLKELGFAEKVGNRYIRKIESSAREEWDDEECRMCTVYDVECYPKPRLDQVQAWLREVQGIDIEINAYQHLDGESIKHQYNFGVLTINGETFANTWYNNYEEALSDAIDTALELLTNQPTAI